MAAYKSERLLAFVWQNGSAGDRAKDHGLVAAGVFARAEASLKK
jgi:hypothetical protein